MGKVIEMPVTFSDRVKEKLAQRRSDLSALAKTYQELTARLNEVETAAAMTKGAISSLEQLLEEDKLERPNTEGTGGDNETPKG